MTPVRPTVVVASPYAGEYGPPRTLEHVTRALDRAGYRAVCVVPPGATLTPGLQRLGPDVRTLMGLTTFPRTLHPHRLFSFFVAHFAAAREIEKIAVAEQAVMVYSISEAIFCGGLAARRVGLPSVVHVIGMSIKSPRLGASVYIRLLDRLTDTFIACSSAVAEMLAQHGVDDRRITVVHNGIPVAQIDDALAGADGERARADVSIGMIAAFDPRKGHELFVEAAAAIARSRSDVTFYIVGGVIDRHRESRDFAQAIERRIRAAGLEGQIVITGYLAPDEVYRRIGQLDVVVVPSRTEAFAHALLEAMACSKPVVATAVEGNLDAFVHDHSGVYVDPSPSDLAAAVLRLLDDPERAAAIGDAARRRVELLFDEAVTLRGLGDAVTDVLLQTKATASPPRRSATRSG